MKVLCIGDLHIKPDNLDLIQLAETQILDALNNHSIDLVVLLGDILHTHERIHTLAMKRACSLFEKLASRAPLYVLVGNHDYIQNDQFLTENHWMVPLKVWSNVTIVDRVVRVDDCLFVPYVPNGRFEEALDTFKGWISARYIFAHQEFKGAVARHGIQLNDGDNWSIDLPRVISGHIHGRQELPIGVYYTGSVLGKQTSMTVLDTNTDERALIPLKFPAGGRTVSARIQDIDALDLEGIDKIVVSDTQENYTLFMKDKLFKQLSARNIKVVFQPTSRAPAAPIVATGSFHELLYNHVLETGDSFIYCALEYLYGNDYNEQDILIVPTKNS